MKVVVIPIVSDTPETIHKGLIEILEDLKIKGQVEAI